MEIENNKQQNGDEKRDKIRRGAELIIQHIPDNRVDNSAIINLSCLINDSGIAQTVVVLPGIEGVFKPLEFLSQQMKAHVIGLNYPYQDPKDTINELGEYLFSVRYYNFIGIKSNLFFLENWNNHKQKW